MPPKYICNILKHKYFWTNATNGINEYRKSVTSILNTHLVTETAEWLAWRTTNDDINLVCLGIVKTYFEKLVVANARQILVVSLYSGRHHFIADGAETGRLKTKRQSTTTRKKIKHQSIFLYVWCQQLVNITTIIRHLFVSFAVLII